MIINSLRRFIKTKKVGIFLGLLIILFLFTFFKTTSSWKEFNNPKFSFTFKYPIGWFEKADADGYGYSVIVSNYQNNCSGCSEVEKKSYTAFLVTNLGELAEEERTNDAKALVLKNMLLDEKRCEEEKRKIGACMPMIPGPAQYLADTNLFQADKTVSAVEVLPRYAYFLAPEFDGSGEFDGLLFKEYSLIKNYNLYYVSLVGKSEELLFQIAKTLKFE